VSARAFCAYARELLEEREVGRGDRLVEGLAQLVGDPHRLESVGERGVDPSQEPEGVRPPGAPVHREVPALLLGDALHLGGVVALQGALEALGGLPDASQVQP